MMADRLTILRLLGKQQPYGKQLLVDNQGTQDIIEAILNKHEKCLAEYDQFAYLFDGGQVPDICKRLFDFCKENLDYVIEKTKSQNVTRPATMLRKGHVDCKGYALFCGGVIDSLKRSGKNISWAFRFASYKIFKKEPYHVFIVVFYKGQEIYVDPVFNSFNFHKPAMWVQDYVMTAEPAKIAGMCCDQAGRLNVLSDGDAMAGAAMGSTTAGYGKQLMAAAPALAEIPVAAAVVEAAGAILTIFGSSHAQGPDVLWLTQLYQFYVMGNAGVTSANKASDSYSTQAQAFFSTVLGVPIGGRNDLNILQNGYGGTNTLSGVPAQTRVNNYLAWKKIPPGTIDNNVLLEAAQIASTLNFNGVPGSWNTLMAAPSILQYAPQTAGQSSVLPSTQTAASPLSSLFQNKWVLIGLVAVGALLIFSNDKK